MKKAYLCVLLLVAAGCSGQEQTVPGRWYTQAQVLKGETVFQANCSGCHGGRAQGLIANWKQRLPNGSYPPPPLNGSAHTWHHPLSVLQQTVKNGSIPLGGTMPGFRDKLNDAEIDAVISFFQSKWSDAIYQVWQTRGGLSRNLDQ